MNRSLLVLVAATCAACASSTPTSSYWNKNGASPAEFAADNQSCSARASRMTPTARADQTAGGVFVQENRMDQPPRHWTHPVADRAYMDCMAERGWTVAAR